MLCVVCLQQLAMLPGDDQWPDAAADLPAADRSPARHFALDVVRHDFARAAADSEAAAAVANRRADILLRSYANKLAELQQQPGGLRLPAASFDRYQHQLDPPSSATQQLAVRVLRLHAALAAQQRPAREYRGLYGQSVAFDVLVPLHPAAVEQQRSGVQAGVERVLRPRLAERIGASAAQRMHLAVLQIVSSRPGKGEQQPHFDNAVWQQASQLYGQFLYCCATVPTAVPLLPALLVEPTFRCDELHDELLTSDVAQRVEQFAQQVLGSEHTWSRPPVQLGSVLTMRISTPHKGSANPHATLDRVLLFCMWSPNRAWVDPDATVRFPLGRPASPPAASADTIPTAASALATLVACDPEAAAAAAAAAARGSDRPQRAAAVNVPAGAYHDAPVFERVLVPPALQLGACSPAAPPPLGELYIPAATSEQATAALCHNCGVRGLTLVQCSDPSMGRAAQVALARSFEEGAVVGYMYGLLIDDASFAALDQLPRKDLAATAAALLAKHGEDYVRPLHSGDWRTLKTGDAYLLASVQCPMHLVNHSADRQLINVSLDVMHVHSQQLPAPAWQAFPIVALRRIRSGEYLWANYGWTPNEWGLRGRRAAASKRLQAAAGAGTR